MMKFLSSCILLFIVLGDGTDGKLQNYDNISIEKFSNNVLLEASKKHPHLKDVKLTSIDPLSLGTFTVKTGDFVVTNTNAFLRGLNKAKVFNIHWDFEKNVARGEAVANVTLASDYETSGTFLYLPITSSGKLFVNGYNLKADVEFKFRKVSVGSCDYLQAYDLKTTQKFGLLNFDLKSYDGCFGFDTIVNAALNANWRELEATGASQTAVIISELVLNAINKVFARIPYNEFIQYVNANY